MWTYNYELFHSGIKGQKWGVRRFQNEDGSLTPAGEQRYAKSGTLKNNKATAKRISEKIAKTRHERIRSKDGNAVYVRTVYVPELSAAKYYKTAPFAVQDNWMEPKDIKELRERTGLTNIHESNDAVSQENYDRWIGAVSSGLYSEKTRTINEIKSKVNKLVANMKYGISKASKRLVETGTKMVQKLLSKLPTKTTMKFTSTTSVSSKEYDPISSPMNPRYRKNN